MAITHPNGHLPLQCSRQYKKVAKFQNVKNKASSKRLYIMSQYQAPTRYPSQHKSLLKRLSMYRYGVSESGIACKGNEKIDYSYLFHGLFLAVRIKNWCLGTQRRLIAPKHTILFIFKLEFQIGFSKCFVDFGNKFLWLEVFHLRKGKPFLS